ncbi:MAG: hypothetical protein KAT22_00165 [Candidatus Thorarchaeota archaeon]|nr:hypothetical protein [Candidatus Thorarchaeota archaeon]
MKDYLKLIKTLKQVMDPNNIMNPGLLGGS